MSKQSMVLSDSSPKNALKKEAISLAYPIEIDGVMTDTLYLRRPKVRDIKLMDSHPGEVDKSIHFLAALCEIPPAAIEDLDAEDFGKLSLKTEGFMASAGKTSDS